MIEDGLMHFIPFTLFLKAMTSGRIFLSECNIVIIIFSLFSRNNTFDNQNLKKVILMKYLVKYKFKT